MQAAKRIQIDKLTIFGRLSLTNNFEVVLTIQEYSSLSAIQGVNGEGESNVHKTKKKLTLTHLYSYSDRSYDEAGRNQLYIIFIICFYYFFVDL